MNREHESEPVPGLPERPPAGERILWQGRPDWRILALNVFHVRAIAAYFAILAAWRVVETVYDHGDVADMAVKVGILALMAAIAVGLFTLLAYLIARTTMYTITSRRVVMRIGMALSMTLNLPFSAIESAALRPHARGRGDIPVKLRDRHRLGYLVLWPHARPWHFMQPEPMLRAIPDAQRVAFILTEAFASSTTDRVARQGVPALVQKGEPVGTLASAAG